MSKLDYPFEDYKSALSKTMRTEREMVVFLTLPQRTNGICGHRALATAESGANSGGAVAYASSLLLKLLKSLIESQTRRPGTMYVQHKAKNKAQQKRVRTKTKNRSRTKPERVVFFIFSGTSKGTAIAVTY